MSGSGSRRHPSCALSARQRETADAERLELVWTTIWQPNEDRYVGRVDPIAVADVVLDGTRHFWDQLV